MCAREIKLTIPILHRAQEQIKREADRFNVLDCGRRFGKDVLGQDLIIDTALEGLPAAWFAPTYRMMLDTWRDLSHTLTAVASKVNAQERRLELITGGWIDLWSLDSPDVARGRKYGRVIVNEAAMVGDLGYAWSNVIRPTLADYQGDAWFLSTPKGRNEFWRMYQRGRERKQGWRSWRFPTLANPFIKPAEVEAMRGEMSARVFEQEIEAAFIEDGTFFMNIEVCADATEYDAARDGHTYVIGVDWARASGGDYTVFLVVDATTRSAVYLDRFSGMDYNRQRDRLRKLWTRFEQPEIVAEYNSMGGPQVEALQADGLPVTGFTTTAGSKHEIISALELAFDQRAIHIPNDPTLILELGAYEKHERAGLPHYSAPDGEHDDTVMALALAWHGATAGVGYWRAI